MDCPKLTFFFGSGALANETGTGSPEAGPVPEMTIRSVDYPEMTIRSVD